MGREKTAKNPLLFPTVRMRKNCCSKIDRNGEQAERYNIFILLSAFLSSSRVLIDSLTGTQVTNQKWSLRSFSPSITRLSLKLREKYLISACSTLSTTWHPFRSFYNILSFIRWQKCLYASPKEDTTFFLERFSLLFLKMRRKRRNLSEKIFFTYLNMYIKTFVFVCLGCYNTLP